MKPSINKVKSKKALIEMRAAMTHLGEVRPGVHVEPEEFFELCRIRQDLEELVKRLDDIMKGGMS